ncbi:hypothetical protein DVK44_10370 [Streptomyces paludis]|uniref:Uncharacterized protein n=1 Tax=Streptomyces paludis TaxID=2282738 RepID=A0A345I0M7_9ACTN|nr:hypothetical protein [Streptomyces paludis]AXG82501.1 hypothetical protein DVK44_10370 [Streptomyces paludis]
MASPGYGKRSVDGRGRGSGGEFGGLPAREASIAGFIDRLPEGADISVKALAKVLDYGQCALRTALNRLQREGYLRRGREHLVGEGGARWVTRTWFSPVARDDSWWVSFISGDVPGDVPGDAVVDVPAALPEPGPRRSRAYAVLASVGLRNPAVTLSAADCAALEPLAAEWFVRGAGEEDVLRALTNGLPLPVHHPAGLVRARLSSKLPPEAPLVARESAVRPPLRVMECSKCRAPGRPEALVGGECGECRGLAVSVPRPAPLSPEGVRARVAEVRAAGALGARAGRA